LLTPYVATAMRVVSALPSTKIAAEFLERTYLTAH
jgi:hypothetical protein